MNDTKAPIMPIDSSLVDIELQNIEKSEDAIAVQALEYGKWLLTTDRFYSTSSASLLWRYNNDMGIWKPNGEQQIQKRLTAIQKARFTSRLINEVVNYIRFSSYSSIPLSGQSNKIVCLNGTLDVIGGKLDDEFHPEEYHISQIPVEYNPDAECTNFKKFLEDVTSSNNDQLALEEFFGYCLLKEYIYEIIVLLVGEGANGKSILLSVLKKFLGSENITSVTPQQLEKSRFASSQLHGKLACIAGDIPSQPLQFTGILKMLTGGDLVHAEFKHRDPFDFLNHAKLIFSANQVPESWDTSRAFYRRFRILEFPNTFEPDDENYIPRDELIEKLTNKGELSGILNLALEGLRRLREQGHLSGEKKLDDKKMEYIKRSDPAHYFFDVFISHDPTALPIEKGLFYDIYVRFCHSIRKVPISDSWFARKIKRLIPFVGETRPMKQQRAWTGIAIDYERYDREVGPLPVDEYESMPNTITGPLETYLDEESSYDITVLESLPKKKEFPARITKTKLKKQNPTLRKVIEIWQSEKTPLDQMIKTNKENLDALKQGYEKGYCVERRSGHGMYWWWQLTEKALNEIKGGE